MSQGFLKAQMAPGARQVMEMGDVDGCKTTGIDGDCGEHGERSCGLAPKSRSPARGPLLAPQPGRSLGPTMTATDRGARGTEKASGPCPGRKPEQERRRPSEKDAWGPAAPRMW